MPFVFSPSDIEKYPTIWREESGEELTPDRVLAEADSFLDLMYQLRSIHQRASKTH